jgi:hypothetical protein
MEERVRKGGTIKRWGKERLILKEQQCTGGERSAAEDESR